MRPRGIFLSGLVLMAAVPALLWAGSYSVTVQSTAPTTDDTFNQQDSPSSNKGDDQELRLKATPDQRNNHPLLNIPLPPALTGKTVLQAWLRLTMFAAGHSEPIDARVFPLLESWDEMEATWNDRLTGLPWQTPGGTRGPFWTGRALLSDAQTGTTASWQVGPILAAWQRGALAQNGVVIEADRGDPDREVRFRSSDYDTPAETPQLLLYVTDEPPAVVSAEAEVQPKALRAGAQDTPLHLWLDVVGSGATPSGAATGMNAITLTHQGALAIRSLDGVWVGATPVPSAQVTWFDNGSALTLMLPRVSGTARVHVALRANVLAPVKPQTLDLPVLVDDSTTPGAWAQSAWSANADGNLGNGDDWTIGVTDEPPVAIEIDPDSASMVNGECFGFTVYGVDQFGNRFVIEPDNVIVQPNDLGTVTKEKFCADTTGSARLIALSGGLRDTCHVTVTGANLPQVAQIVLRDQAGSAVSFMTPQDSMRLEVVLSDGDGFRDIEGMDFVLSYANHEDDDEAPAFHAEYRWRRQDGAWALVDPSASSWALDLAACEVDTATDVTAPQMVRLGFVPGTIARASTNGEWGASIRVSSATPPDTSTFTLDSLDVQRYVATEVKETEGWFNTGREGATHLPLATPADGRLHVRIVANDTWNLEAIVSDMVGDSSASDTLHLGSPTPRIEWGFGSTAVGRLDTTFTTMAAGQPPLSTEIPAEREVHLWIDHPPGIPPQSYRGDIGFRAGAASTWSSTTATPLIATVVGGGQAATSAVAEVLPNSVQAGEIARPFRAFLYPSFQPGDTGIDRLLVNIPPGYGTPVVTGVNVAGLPVSFSDASSSNFAEVLLSSRLLASDLVEIQFDLDTPTAVDSGGASLVVLYDDAGTALAAQAATEGDANGVGDGDDWTVTVLPGPATSLVVGPNPALCFLDSTLTFTANAFDAWGHPTTATVTWSVLGGVGSIGASSGVFAGTSLGNGRVVASTGSIADTAQVAVRAVRGIAVREVRTTSTAYQGQAGLVARVRVENIGAEDASLDTVRLLFRRGSSSDAGADFQTAVAPPSPLPLAAGDTVWVETEVSVADNAGLGPVTVDARAAALAVASSVRIIDHGASVTAELDIVVGGIEVTASQLPAPVRPGNGTTLFALTLLNRYPVSRELQRLAFANRASGPGDPDQLDRELGEVRLFLDDGDGALDPSTDALLLETVAVGGSVNFAPLHLPLSPGAIAPLLVESTPPLDAREGDRLDLELVGSAAIAFDSATIVRAGWPLAPAGSFAIDGLVAAQLAVVPVGSGTATAGSANQLAFSARLPANGYTADVLERLGVVNRGTARASSEIAGVRAWVDDGDGFFSSSSDRALGAMAWTGSRWEVTGLAEPVTLAGLLVHVTVDLAASAEEGRTLRLAFPAGSDFAVGMASGNSGPLDAAVENPFDLVVSGADRIALGAASAGELTVRPGQRDVVLLDLVATNSYASPRTVTAVGFTNVSAGSGAPGDLDRELERLVLRMDGDDDGILGDPAADPVVGVGLFSSGQVSFDGLQWALPSGASRHLFLTGDVSLRDAADGDRLAVSLTSSADIAVLEPSSIVASWPITAPGARVDGMVAAQVAVFPRPGVTLAPGDGPVAALDWILPRNGYADDVLAGVRVVNLGTAGPSDLAELRLWRDGGDGMFDAGAGDDRDLGELVSVAGGWQSPLLGEPVPGLGARLFVSFTVSSAPTDSVSVRLAVPTMGLALASGNDGPLDLAIENPQPLLISTAPLLASLETVPNASTVGATVELRMAVRNVGSETLLGVKPGIPRLTGNASLTLVSGPLPDSLDLAPAAADTFLWTYTAAQVGEARFEAGAEATASPSGVRRRSLEVASDLHRVFTSVPSLGLYTVHSMPLTVRAGQTGVVPFSLTFSNPGGSSGSSARIERLRVRLEDQAGNGIVPSQLVRRVVVNEGVNVYLDRSSIETAGADLDLQLAPPVTVTPEEPVTVSVRLDLADSLSVPTFRAVITDSTAIGARDATSGAPVWVQVASGTYPVRSSVARVVAEATRLDVSAAGGVPARVAPGTADVSLLDLALVSPGLTGITSDVRVHALRVVVTDSAGLPDPRPADRLSRLRVSSGAQTVASRLVAASEGETLGVLLNPPLNVPANSTVPLVFTGDLAATATVGTLRLRLGNAVSFDAEDANTRDAVPAFYASDPVAGPPIAIESAAETLLARGTPRFPASVSVGRAGVSALEAVLRHPHAPGTARIRVDSLVVQCRDEARRPRAPSAFLSRLVVRWNGATVADLTSIPASPSGVPVTFVAPLIEPGDSARFELVMDVSPAAPASFLELEIAAAGLAAVDANDGHRVRLEPEEGGELPLRSGLTRILPAARDLVVGLESRMPAVLAGDGRDRVVALLRLENPAPAGAGPIAVDRLVLSAVDGALAPVALGAAAASLAILRGGVPWAQSAALTPDSVTAVLAGTGVLEVLTDQPVELELRMTCRAEPSLSAFRVSLEAAGVGVVQPGSGALVVQVRPADGQSFPLRTEVGNFSPAALAESWSNFPNPFAAGREGTTFAYYLRTGARVTLRLFTLRSDPVVTLLTDAPRPAGLHQVDRWDGRNGAGEVVRNGVYVAEISVRYDDGSDERLMRKVAVVR